MSDFEINAFNIIPKKDNKQSLGSSKWSAKETLIALLICVLLILFLKRIWKITILYKKYLWNIPGPFAFPIIGCSYLLIGSPKHIFNALYKMIRRYPSGICSFWHGPYLYFCIDNPKYYEIILPNPKALGKDYNYKELGLLMGDGLISTLNLNHWRRHRKVIQPTFKQPILDSFVPIFTENIEVLIKILRPLCGKKDVDVYHYISRYTLDTICEAAMGTKVQAQTSDTLYAEKLEKTAELIFQKIFFIFYKIDLIFQMTGKMRMLTECINYMQDYSQKVLKKKKAIFKQNMNETHFDTEGKTRKVFLDYLLEYNVFDDKEITDEVITFLVAGTETTATTMCFVLTVLGMYPDVQEKVREEVISIAGNRVLDSTDLPKLTYLEMVLKETMRLFPIVNFILRTLTDDIDLKDGKVLPRGASVLLLFIATHRNERYWKDPLKFDPYRFLPEAKREPNSFIPFSIGPRNCIGLKYAMMSMKTLIASLVREYTIKCDYKNIEDIELLSYFSLRPTNGFKVSFEER